MFGNYPNQFGYTSMPTATQPYGYPMNPYTTMGNNSSTPAPQPYTNLIYVNGIEDVRNRPVPAGGTMLFADNDKPLVYKKTVDSKGQFEVETFDIIPHKEEEPKVTEPTDYVPKTEFSALKKRLAILEGELTKLMYDKTVKQEVVIDGTTSSTNN